ncbi:MAG: hypothetical protein H7222_03965 [Methylotenera sp.]|nr:hypothetical protein [Oligoflexia bacterium]
MTRNNSKFSASGSNRSGLPRVAGLAFSAFILLSSSSAFAVSNSFKCDSYISGQGYLIPPTQSDYLVCSTSVMRDPSAANSSAGAWCKCSGNAYSVKSKPANAKPAATAAKPASSAASAASSWNAPAKKEAKNSNLETNKDGWTYVKGHEPKPSPAAAQKNAKVPANASAKNSTRACAGPNCGADAPLANAPAKAVSTLDETAKKFAALPENAKAANTKGLSGKITFTPKPMTDAENEAAAQGLKGEPAGKPPAAVAKAQSPAATGIAGKRTYNPTPTTDTQNEATASDLKGSPAGKRPAALNAQNQPAKGTAGKIMFTPKPMTDAENEAAAQGLKGNPAAKPVAAAGANGSATNVGFNRTQTGLPGSNVKFGASGNSQSPEASAKLNPSTVSPSLKTPTPQSAINDYYKGKNPSSGASDPAAATTAAASASRGGAPVGLSADRVPGVMTPAKFNASGNTQSPDASAKSDPSTISPSLKTPTSQSAINDYYKGKNPSSGASDPAAAAAASASRGGAPVGLSADRVPGVMTPATLNKGDDPTQNAASHTWGSSPNSNSLNYGIAKPGDDPAQPAASHVFGGTDPAAASRGADDVTKSAASHTFGGTTGNSGSSDPSIKMPTTKDGISDYYKNRNPSDGAPATTSATTPVASAQGGGKVGLTGGNYTPQSPAKLDTSGSPAMTSNFGKTNPTLAPADQKAAIKSYYWDKATADRAANQAGAAGVTSPQSPTGQISKLESKPVGLSDRSATGLAATNAADSAAAAARTPAATNAAGTTPASPVALTDREKKAQRDGLDRDEKREIGRSLQGYSGLQGKDECSVGSMIDGKFRCDGTRGLVSGAVTANALSQAAASTATQIAGATAQNKATTDGTQSSVNLEAAKLQNTTGMTQVGIGAVNAVLGVLQLNKGTLHKRQAQDLNAGSPSLRSKVKFQDSEGNEVQLMNEVAGTTQAFQQQAIAAKQNEVLRKAADEQSTISSAAKGGALVSILTGAQMIGQGAVNMAAAKAAKARAAELANLEGRGGKIPGFDNTNLTNQDSGARGANSITGDGTSTILDATSDTSGADTTASLGAPFNPGQADNSVNPGAPSGAFEKGSTGGPAAGGSGGGGMGGGGGTSPSDSGAATDPAAKYAEQVKTQGNYEGGGGGARAGGAGGGKADAGLDLNGLLAQFLPKPEEEKDKHNSILEYGSRSPASDGAPEALLGKDANLFQRISETYKDKNGKGFVGI